MLAMEILVHSVKSQVSISQHNTDKQWFWRKKEKGEKEESGPFERIKESKAVSNKESSSEIHY